MTKLSVKSHDCTRIMQIKAFYTCSYFTVAKVVTCALNNLILSCLFHKLLFIDLPVGQAKLENNLPKAISAWLEQASKH